MGQPSEGDAKPSAGMSEIRSKPKNSSAFVRKGECLLPVDIFRLRVDTRSLRESIAWMRSFFGRAHEQLTNATFSLQPSDLAAEWPRIA